MRFDSVLRLSTFLIFLSFPGVSSAADFDDFPRLALNSAMSRAEAVSEIYRAEFDRCDKTDKFENATLPIKKFDQKSQKYRTIWYGCKTDPSHLHKLVRIPQVNETREAIIFESKLALDHDGSAMACNTPGLTDQCPTTLMLRPTPTKPCPKVLKGKLVDCLPVDADTIPYIVIPASGPPGVKSKEFQSLTGVKTGDFGVVFANGRSVPVIVADTGPAYKIGEGSAALLRALSANGKPDTIGGGVTFVLFPDSRDASYSADTLADRIKEGAAEMYSRLDTQGE